MKYNEALKKITSQDIFRVELGLERVRAVLQEFGNPQDSLKCIHVAGTNGKGSTVAMLSSVLSTAGYKTGRYVSPYVLEFRERMMINGKMIGRKRLVKIVEAVKEKADALLEHGIMLNAFEVTTACAMLWKA